ncbi:rnf126 [Symbiodinium sp. CCMP2456]|nr:rnf126 [Symbiodinium sp. CCMP2456]
MSLLAADLEKLSVADLKKRLFWAGASLPDGHLEKADIISVVKKAEEEKAEKAAEADQKRVEEERGVPKPDPKPLDFDNIKCPDEEKQIVELHLLTEKQLRDRIEQAGHDVPKGEPSKHYLVALCRKAMKDPREPKPKKAEAQEDEEEEAVVPNRRPTIGDRVQIRDTMIMKRYLPEAIGKVFRIFKDDGGAFPYRLAGVGEQRHWFSEDDICWPVKKAQKTFITQKERERTKAKPDNQPEKVVINHNRYGCTAGEVRDVLGETADKRNWVLSGGRQVPKMHEGSGWSRKVENSNTICDARRPPPPPGSVPRAPAPVTVSEEEMIAQMEEMQAELDAQAAQAQAPQKPVPPAAPEAPPVEPVTAPTPAAPPSPAKPSLQKAQDPTQKDETANQAATEPSVNGASVVDPGEERFVLPKSSPERFARSAGIRWPLLGQRQGTSTQGVLRSLERQENAAHVVREPRLPNARSLAVARQMAVSAALRTVRRAVRDAADEAVSGPPRRRQATRQDRPRPTERCRISPLFEAVVAALPAAEVPTRHDIPKGERCAVCHGKLLRRGRKIRHLPCGHIFHDDCILPWLQKRTVCPLCRRDFSTMVQESKQRRDASWVATMLSRENQPNEEEAAAESLQLRGDLPILLD